MRASFPRPVRWWFRQAASATFVFLLLWCASACGHPPQAAQSSPPPLQFLGEWGHSGSAPGEFQNPQSITCDSAGSVYIADDGKPARIEKFSASGQPLLVFSISANQNDSDIAVDAGNAIFIVDRRHGQVQIYSPEGEQFRTLFFRYRKGFHDPNSIAIEPGGDFYLADFLAGRIMRMNPLGRSLQSLPKPQGVDGRWTPDLIRLGEDGNLYAANASEQRIEKLSPEGRCFASWSFSFTGLDSSLSSPKLDGLAVSRSFIAASNGPKRTLGVWNLNGQPSLTVDFSHHPEWGDKATPSDIAFAPDGELFVLDRPDFRVLRFKLNIQP